MRITLVPESERADTIKMQGRPIITSFDDLGRDSSDWLWPDRIPAGKVTLFSGDPEMGKSFVSLDIAARVSSGAAWPGEEEEGTKGRWEEGKRNTESGKFQQSFSRDSEHRADERENAEGKRGRWEEGTRNALREDTMRIDAAHRFGDAAISSSNSSIITPNSSISSRSPGSVLLLNAEDDPTSTIRPRLEAMGADLSKIKILSGVRCNEAMLPYSLGYGVEMLERTANAMGDCKLIVIDPIMSYVGGISSSNTNQVRALLDPLKGLAERTGAAVILVNHLCKKKGSPMYRSIGSISIIGMARMAWAFAPCNRREDYRMMLPLKNNLTEQKEGLAYRIVDGRVMWDTEPVEITTREAFEADPQEMMTNALKFARDWLSDQLADGEWKPVKDIDTKAVAAGISIRTLRRAKAAMGDQVEAQHKSIDAPWEWKLSNLAKFDQWMKDSTSGYLEKLSKSG